MYIICMLLSLWWSVHRQTDKQVSAIVNDRPVHQSPSFSSACTIPQVPRTVCFIHRQAYMRAQCAYPNAGHADVSCRALWRMERRRCRAQRDATVLLRLLLLLLSVGVGCVEKYLRPVGQLDACLSTQGGWLQRFTPRSGNGRSNRLRLAAGSRTLLGGMLYI